MNRSKIFTLILLSLLFLVACKKDKMPSFSATGFWSGFLSSGPATIDFLNRPDGTCRVYLLTSPDTAMAFNKFDGTFNVANNTFQALVADTIFSMKIHSLHTTVNTIDGILFLNSTTLGETLSYPFEVLKQE